MSVRLNSKLIADAPNVVRLPTASPRQVKQEQNHAAREERRRFRQENPWPGEYVPGPLRDARHPMEALARGLLEMGRTPELGIISAILEEFSPAALQRMKERAATSDNSEAREAAIFLEAAALDGYGRRSVIEPMDRLKGERDRGR